MDVGQLLQTLWAQLAGNLGGDLMAVLIVTAFVVALTAIWLVVGAIRRTEFFKQYQSVWELVDDRIADLVWLIEVGDVDLTEYERKAEQREQEGLSHVDPRMLYLLDKAEEWVNATLNIELDFDVLLARAEHIFDEIKNAEGNSVGN